MEEEGGGGARYAQEQRTEEEKAGKHRAAAGGGGGGGGMKFSVSARAPHGVGALLLIGGAVLAGAAFVAWRHARRGKTDRYQPANKEEVSGDGGGVVEEGGKTGASAPETDQPDDNKVLGGASPGEVDRPDDDLRPEEEEEETNQDDVGVTEEAQQVHEDAEIVASDESFFQNSEQVRETDIDLGKSSTDIPMHDDDDVEDNEPVKQNSSAKLPEITVGDTDGATVKKGDEDSMKNDTEDDHNLTENDTENDQDPTTDHMETDNPSKNDLKKEIVPPNVQVDEDADASDKSSCGISRPGIVLLGKQSLLLRGDGGAQEAESMENSPTAQLMMHPDQLLENSDLAMDTQGETAEAEPGKGTTTTTTAEPVGLAAALSSSLVKPAEKKERPSLIEAGMKIEQDRRTNPGPKEHRHGLIAKAGGGAAVVTMDRGRSSSVAIVALMFALTLGMAIVLRSYAPPRATKLLMDLLP